MITKSFVILCSQKLSSHKKHLIFSLYFQAVASGDIVSNLMNMENASLIDTRSRTTLHEVVTDSVNVRSRLGSTSRGTRKSSAFSTAASSANNNVRGRSASVKNVQRRASLGFQTFLFSSILLLFFFFHKVFFYLHI